MISKRHTADEACAPPLPCSRSALLIVFVLSLCAHTASAFDVALDVQPRVLNVGETATLSLTVFGLSNAAMPQLPDIDGFTVQSSGREEQFSFGTGGSQRKIVFNYRLLATKAGRFAVGPFDYSANGQQVTIPAVEVQVVSGGASAASEPGQAQLGDLLFARVDLERSTVYHQEFFDVYISLFYRGLRLGREVEATGLPSGIAFNQLQELRSSREVINGQVFEARRFRLRAHALTAGTFTLQPSIQAQLRVRQQRTGRRSIFDEFFGSAFGEQLQPVQIQPQPVEVVVKPLPDEDRPEHFSGAVGRFTFDVQVAPVELVAGEPVTITSTITGRGNIGSISAPKLVLGDEYKVYDARLLEKNVGAGQGSKTFEQVVIPRTEAAARIPAMAFTFFDPEQESYQTLERGPFELSVTPSPEGPAQIVDGNLSPARRRSAEVLGRDIVYLKPAPSDWQQVGARSWYATPAFVAMQGVPLLALAISFFLTRRRSALARDVAKARRIQAPKSARPGLKHADEALQRGEPLGVYEGLSQAGTAYFANRLNLQPGDVEIDRVADSLRANGLDESRTGRLLAIFAACEEGRFGRAATDTAATEEARAELTALVRDMKDILKSCERIKL